MDGSIKQAAEDVLVLDKVTGESFEIDRPSLKANPERYHVPNKDYEPPTIAEVMAAKKQAPYLTWGFPNLVHELPELERTSEATGIPTSALLEAASTATLVDLDPSIWSSMGNTDSWETDTIDKALYHAKLYDKDVRAVIQGISEGNPMQAPLVLSTGESTLLMGGNTRLMTFRALGITPKVLLVRVASRKTGDRKMARELIAFENALTARAVAVRFAKEKVELNEADLLRARGLPRARKVVDSLVKLADRSEEILGETEEDLTEGAEKRLRAIRDKALTLSHEMAKTFDELVPVYHALPLETARKFRPVFDLYFDLNKVWFQTNAKSFNAENLAAETHAISMACSALVSQYAMTLREVHAQNLGMVKEAMVRIAIEFPTEKARKLYLKEHPKADKSKHTVVKKEPGKPVPKDKGKEPPKKGQPKSPAGVKEDDAEIDDEKKHQKSEAYKTRKNKNYYPEKAPPGLKRPALVEKLPANEKELIFSMPDADLDKTEAYNHPAVKKVVSQLKKQLKEGKIHAEDILRGYNRYQAGGENSIADKIHEGFRNAKTDAASDEYRFPMRKVLQLWRAYNDVLQSDEYKRAKDPDGVAKSNQDSARVKDTKTESPKKEEPKEPKEEEADVDEFEHRRSPEYKTKRSDTYYPQKPPAGLKDPPELKKMDPEVKKLFDTMPDEDLDTNESYEHPAVKKVTNNLVKQLKSGKLKTKDLMKVFMDMDVSKPDGIRIQMHDGFSAAKSDADADKYRFPMRKAYKLWQAYNAAYQSKEFKEAFARETSEMKNRLPESAKALIKKHDLPDRAIEVMRGMAGKGGKKRSPQQELEDFKRNAPPEMRKRLQGMSVQDFKAMMAAISDEEEGA